MGWGAGILWPMFPLAQPAPPSQPSHLPPSPPPGRRLSIKRDRQHVLFGGTKLLQATGDRGARVRTPDGGCLAVVLRTGFGTAQGEPPAPCLFAPFPACSRSSSHKAPR